MKKLDHNVLVLYVLSMLGSGCGFITQMMVSGFWTTTFSDDVYHYSVNLAVYFLSLGIGSLLADQFRKPSRRDLFRMVLAIVFWTGLSLSILRLGILKSPNPRWLPIFVVAVSGILSGTIIPLTLRIERNNQRLSLATLFFADYVAAILFTLLFTYVFLVPMGYGKTMLIVWAIGTLVTSLLVAWARAWDVGIVATMICASLIPLPFHVWTVQSATDLVSKNPDVKVVYSRQSHYQKIVLTEERGKGSFNPGVPVHVLYLDGMVQFSSVDEAAYHACIANVPMAAVETMGDSVRNVLILGGGDGLAARNLLAVPKIKTITLVELDPAMIELATTQKHMRAYNLDSLKSPRVRVIVDDAFRWMKHASEKYDLIIVDFPHPKNLSLARLFSAEFYREVLNHLKPNGVAAIQAGPSVDPGDPNLMTLSRVPLTVRTTIRKLGANAHIYASPRDLDSFVIATNNQSFDMNAFTKRVGMVGLKGMGLICTYNPEWRESEVKANTLNNLSIAGHMIDWMKRTKGPFFQYAGYRGIFLPD